MTFRVVAVHPAVTMVQTDDRQVELPTAWFPRPPKVGQEWEIKLDHLPTDQEQLAQLNAYLIRD